LDISCSADAVALAGGVASPAFRLVGSGVGDEARVGGMISLLCSIFAGRA
jgi:hypothetical protein